MPSEYLNNKAFEAAIERFRKAQKRIKRKPQEFQEAQIALTEAFYLLSSNIIRAFKFQLVDKDDALQEGVMICFEKLHRFDASRGHAFVFMTTIILNHFRQLYRSAKNHNELKRRFHDFLCDRSTEAHLQRNKSKNNSYRRNNIAQSEE